MPLSALIKAAAAPLLGASTALYEGRQNRKVAEKQFNAQMDQSIQRRVADAQKAGIHPLFALGGNAGASPTVSGGSSGVAAAGDAIAQGYEKYRANQASKTAQEKADQLLSAQLHQANAASGRDAAEAALLDSQRALAEQELVTRGRDSSAEAIAPKYKGSPDGPAIEYVKPEVPYKQPGDATTQAGVGPLWVEKLDTPTRTIHVPQEDTNLDFPAAISGGYGMIKNRHNDRQVKNNRNRHRVWNSYKQRWETYDLKPTKRGRNKVRSRRR